MRSTKAGLLRVFQEQEYVAASVQHTNDLKRLALLTVVDDVTLDHE